MTTAATKTSGNDRVPDEVVDLARKLHANLQKVLLGTPTAVTVAVVAAISGGHLLLEDVPGVGKTVLARTLATSLGADLSRVQGHPDLLPTDITGVSIYSQDSGTWEFRPGPVFAHLVLVDELNRTPPRTQSALLESMEERQVSVDGSSWPLPYPHLVIATQNPIGQLGTYPLVESQLDRFAVCTPLGYPDAATETQLALQHGGRAALEQLKPVCGIGEWEAAIVATTHVYVAPAIAEYAVTISRGTRQAGSVRLGTSPRASISLVRSSQAHALLYGRDYVSPVDIQAMAVPSLAHRLVTDGGHGAMNGQVGAGSQSSQAATIINSVVASIPAPRP
jgi:MoxR-like ATPase